MAVNLSKGQKISLDKGMTLALVGLGWDTNRYSGGACLLYTSPSPRD